MPNANRPTGDSPTLLRSGAAARLAGLSSATLRVWEHRYGVVAPPRSASGQRTYSMDDVQRLRLIKRLTLDGHAIGTVARLPVEELERLSSGRDLAQAGEQRMVVIGLALAQKLEGRLRPAAVVTFADLAEAESQVASCGPTDVLAVHVPSLHRSVTDRVLALRTALPARAVVVVYSFGTEAAADALRAADVTVCREPATGHELAQAIAQAKRSPQPDARAVPSSPRRFSDSELVALAETPSDVACECPRHLAEIVTLLVGFERYSAECASNGPRDAALHRQLHEVTSAARSLFEEALTRVVVEERLVLPR